MRLLHVPASRYTVLCSDKVPVELLHGTQTIFYHDSVSDSVLVLQEESVPDTVHCVQWKDFAPITVLSKDSVRDSDQRKDSASDTVLPDDSVQDSDQRKCSVSDTVLSVLPDDSVQDSDQWKCSVSDTVLPDDFVPEFYFHTDTFSVLDTTILKSKQITAPPN